MPVRATQNFRVNLREALEFLDLTQDAFAEKAALSRPFVNKILSGRQEPSLSTCDQIADSLQIPLANFLANPAVFRQFLKNFASPIETA